MFTGGTYLKIIFQYQRNSPKKFHAFVCSVPILLLSCLTIVGLFQSEI